MRGLKNHGSKELRKRFPEDLQWQPFGRLFGVQNHPRAIKTSSMWEVLFWYDFREVDRVPPGGVPPPVSGNSGGPVGRTTGGAEATENLTRLMTPKGSADLHSKQQEARMRVLSIIHSCQDTGANQY